MSDEAGFCPSCGEACRNSPPRSERWECLVCDSEVIVENPAGLDTAQQIDIIHLTNELRKLELRLSRIPKHSGRATSEERAALRKRRADLRDQIQEARDDIVAWAITNVPVSGDAIQEGLSNG